MRPISPVPAVKLPNTPLLTNYTLAILTVLEAAVCGCLDGRVVAASGEVGRGVARDAGNGAEELDGVAERYGL